MSEQFANHCVSGGWVVKNSTVLLDCYGYDVESLPVRGCSRIHCSHCHADVRHFDGLMLRVVGPQPDLEAIYVRQDPDPSVFKPNTAIRFYFCRCEFHMEMGQTALADKEHQDSLQIYTWRCMGHEYATVPHELDGETITTDNVDEVARRTLTGWAPPKADETDRTGAYWIARLYFRLERTQLAREILRVASEAMEDTDVGVRTRALRFFFLIASPTGASRALRLLQGSRTLFADVADKMTRIVQDKTLEDTLWRLAAPLVAGPARELARVEAVSSARASRALYDAMFAHDREWTIEHLEELARAAPSPDVLIEACKRGLPKGAAAPLLDRIRGATS